MPLRTKIGLIGAPSLLIYMMLAWAAGSWLGLHGLKLWIFRSALWLLGLAAAALIFWFVKRSREPEATADDEELDTILAAAQERLAATRARGRGRLSNAPMILFLGPENSAKSSVILHSGLEPDLLAGAVYHGDSITPTRAANLWFTDGTVLLEAGGALLGDPSRWSRLIRHIRPQTPGVVLSGRPQAPRVAVICFSCEELLKPDSGTAVPAAARELRELLLDLAQAFGIQLPVYVLFTKADRIPHFAEYVRNLSNEEAREALGTTLRWPVQVDHSWSSDREYQRLSDAFQRIFTSLADKRLRLLPRDSDEIRKSGVYEFPREFRKLSGLATQFLVDLCRPSQLNVSPVLRGFYFSGVRAVVVSAPAQLDAPQARAPDEPGRIAASQAFDPRRRLAEVEPEPRTTPTSRRIPQWVFLERLFRSVFLRDQLAMGVTQGGARLNMWRRLALASTIAVSLLLATCFTASYVGNHRLEARVLDAARGLDRVVSNEPELPTPETLNRLEGLRNELAVLGDWSRNGAPLRLRWGLYKGSDVYSSAGKLWLNRFEHLMLAPTRKSLESSLRSLPDDPGKAADHAQGYDLLKAYLMITTDTDKTDSTFLAPYLAVRWLRDRQIDDQRWELARRQIALYSGHLCLGEDLPCARASDPGAVGQGRRFLGEFTGADFVYQGMIAKASRETRSVQFNRTFPEAAAAVVNSYEVPGAFTTAGWALVHEAMKQVGDLYQTESWVLGEQAMMEQDPVQLADTLRARYLKDYARHWRAYLDAASVLKPGSVRDAAQMLDLLKGNQSPLLQLLHLAAKNTTLDSARAESLDRPAREEFKTVESAFQPVRAVVPPEVKEVYVVESNQPYINSLIDLHAIVNEAVSTPGVPAADVSRATRGVASAVDRLAQSFDVVHPDARAVGERVETLLKAPTRGVESLVGTLPKLALDQAGREFCRVYQPLMNKYPFNSEATREATLAEVAQVFQPGSGALWRFYDEHLQDILVKQGPVWAGKPGAPLRVYSRFEDFFSRAASVSEALWPDGATASQFTFTFKPVLTAEIASVTLTVDGRPKEFTRYRTAGQGFSWIGEEAREVRLIGQIRGREEELYRYDGTWALFKLFRPARWRPVSASRHEVEWTLPEQNVTLTAQLDLGRVPAILRGDYFARADCVDRVVQ